MSTGGEGRRVCTISTQAVVKGEGRGTEEQETEEGEGRGGAEEDAGVRLAEAVDFS